MSWLQNYVTEKDKTYFHTSFNITWSSNSKRIFLHIPMSVFNIWNVLRLCLFMRPWKYLFDSNSWYKWSFVPQGQYFFTSNHMRTGWGGDRCVRLYIYFAWHYIFSKILCLLINQTMIPYRISILNKCKDKFKWMSLQTSHHSL